MISWNFIPSGHDMTHVSDIAPWLISAQHKGLPSISLLRQLRLSAALSPIWSTDYITVLISNVANMNTMISMK